MGEKLTFEQYVDKTFVVVRRGGDNWDCQCPWHNDNSPSLRVDVKRGLYYCHGCGKKGTLLKLGKETGSEVTIPDIHDYVMAKLRPLKERDAPIPEGRLIPLTMMRDYWTVNRGLSEATCDRFQLGMDMTNRTATLPMRDVNGMLIGIIERQLVRSKEAGPKYHYPPSVRKQAHLYAAWEVGMKDREVVLVEGQVDALALWDVGIPAVAMAGSVLDKRQVRILKRMGVHHVIIFTDNDAEGEKALDHAAAMLTEAKFLWSIANYGRSKAKDPGAMRPAQRIRAVETAIRGIDLKLS